MPVPHADVGAAEAIERWAASGAMALTGPPEGSGLGPPGPLVPRLQAVAALLETRSAAMGGRVQVDPLGLLTERAAIAGLHRGGQVSCGGGARLLRTADRWLAVSLARADDVELVPAWLGIDPPGEDPWPAVAARLTEFDAQVVVEQGRLLGLPLGALPVARREAPVAPSPLAPLPMETAPLGDAPPADDLDGLVVVELGSLWAGPLCGSLLAQAGAAVVKVESVLRPDGARLGPQPFFDRLNRGKRAVALDLGSESGRSMLHRLLERADVVIEGSRPRALAQLGVEADALIRDGGPRVWVSITGHGRTGDAASAVGFGDDAAVAGGLVAWDGADPCFCADAVADPATGLVAAAAVLDALHTGGRWLLDLALARTAAHLAGPTLPVPPGTPERLPVAPPPGPAGPGLGEHTDEVLAELGISS